MSDATPLGEPSPYQRFEDFLRRLVAVPKAEIDAKAAEYQAQAQEKKADREARSA